MKFFLFLIAMVLPVTLLANNYDVDAAHSSVVFRVKHLGVSYTYGCFNDIKGNFNFDAANVGKSSLTVEVKAESIDTNNEKRDKHLKGPDFFDAKRHSTITFTSTKVEKGKDNQLKVTGNLTMRGVTKEVTVDMDFVGEGKDPWGGYRCGFETTFTVKRSEFGMNYMVGPNLADDVRITVSVEGIKKQA